MPTSLLRLKQGKLTAQAFDDVLCACLAAQAPASGSGDRTDIQPISFKNRVEDDEAKQSFKVMGIIEGVALST